MQIYHLLSIQSIQNMLKDFLIYFFSPQGKIRITKFKNILIFQAENHGNSKNNWACLEFSHSYKKKSVYYSFDYLINYSKKFPKIKFERKYKSAKITLEDFNSFLLVNFLERLRKMKISNCIKDWIKFQWWNAMVNAWNTCEHSEKFYSPKI